MTARVLSWALTTAGPPAWTAASKIPGKLPQRPRVLQQRPRALVPATALPLPRRRRRAWCPTVTSSTRSKEAMVAGLLPMQTKSTSMTFTSGTQPSRRIAAVYKRMCTSASAPVPTPVEVHCPLRLPPLLGRHQQAHLLAAMASVVRQMAV